MLVIMTDMQVQGGGGEGADGAPAISGSETKLLKIVRLLRLAKLFRLLRASRIFRYLVFLDACVDALRGREPDGECCAPSESSRPRPVVLTYQLW